MKRVISVLLILILTLSAVSFSVFAENMDTIPQSPDGDSSLYQREPSTDLAESSAGYIPPHPYYSSYAIPGTTGGGTKEDPIIVDTFDELKKALEYPLNGLYIRCDTCSNTMGLDYIAVDGYKGSATSNFVAIEVNYDKNLTLNANLDCRSSRVSAPFLDALISVQAYLKVDGTGSISGSFSALENFRNSVFSVFSPGVLELNGITVAGAHGANGMTDRSYGYAVWADGGAAVFNSGSFKGIGILMNGTTMTDSPISAVNVEGSAHVIVNGGTFQSSKSKETYGINMKPAADVTLAGGTFYGIKSDSKTLSSFLKSDFAYKRVSGGATFNGSSVKQTTETLRVDYTGSGLRPTEQLSSSQIPMGVGYEFLHFTSPDDNTWYNDPLEYYIEGNSEPDYFGNSCYLDYAGIDEQAYDLYDNYDQLMRQGAYCSFSSDYKPIKIKFYLTAGTNYIFKSTSYVQINGKKADLQIINGKQAIASVELTYNDSNKVVDNIELKGSFVPTAGQSASTYNGTLNYYIDCDDGKCEVTNSRIGESGRYNTPYTGTLVAGNTYYMWFEVKNYTPYIYGVDLTYSFCDSTGKSNPSSYSKNYGSLMGETGAVWVSVPFIVPAQNEGCMIRGTVTSFLNSSNNVFLQLLQGNTVKNHTNVTGNTVSYSITKVAKGTYTLRVSKKNHVDRDYTVSISGDKTQDVKICPIGDANINGSVTSADASAIYKHLSGAKLIDDPYAFKCADANQNGSVTSADASAIYKHLSGTKKLFS